MPPDQVHVTTSLPSPKETIGYTISQYALLCLYQHATQSTVQDKTLTLAEIHNRISVLSGGNLHCEPQSVRKKLNCLHENGLVGKTTNGHYFFCIDGRRAGLQSSTVLTQFLLLHQEHVLQRRKEKITNLKAQLHKVEDILAKKRLTKKQDHRRNVEKVTKEEAAAALMQWHEEGLLQLVDQEGVQCEAYIGDLQSKGRNQKAKYPIKKVSGVNLPLHHIALIAAGRRHELFSLDNDDSTQDQRYEVSHRCKFKRCTTADHLVVELSKTNSGRNDCLDVASCTHMIQCLRAKPLLEEHFLSEIQVRFRDLLTCIRAKKKQKGKEKSPPRRRKKSGKK